MVHFTQKFLKKSLYAILLLVVGAWSMDAMAQQQPTDQKKTGVNIMITQSPKIHVKVEAVSHNFCFNDGKGAINITPSGGYPPYRYHWSNGDTTQDIAALKAGKYRVAVYDGLSCSDTVEIAVNEPPQLLGKVTSVKDILCYGYNNGEVDIEVSGGKAPYTYSWSNGARTEDIKGINSGRYSVLVTDANACQEIITAEVIEKPLIVRWVDDVENIKCNGDATGKIDISVNGGVPPYTYAWSNGATTEDLSSLKSGNYQVVVKDSKECTEVSLTKVVEPGPITVTLDELRNLNCFGDLGGAINIGVNGGKQPYRYKWTNGSTNQDIAGVPAGDYTVEVLDNNGCVKSYSTKLTEPPMLSITLVDFKNISYNGGKNGTVNIDVSGGIPPYKYRWNNGSETQDLANLEAGSYMVRVNDATGCAKMMTVTLSQPPPLVANMENTKNVNCFGEKTGEINISVAGGVPPYTYAWNNGQTIEDLSGLPAGKYSVVITDANGFTRRLEASVTEPPAFKASVVSVTNIECNAQLTGAVDVKVDGGVLPYRYRWSGGQVSQDLVGVGAGEYTLKITDANLCEHSVSAKVIEPEPLKLALANTTNINCAGQGTGSIDLTVAGGVAPYKYKWTNGIETEDIKAVKAGSYSVTVTDSKGCNQQISAVLAEPQPLIVREESVKNVDCSGNGSGSITLTVAGGVTPYQFAWSNGATTKDVTSLKAGAYSMKVTDANGCTNAFNKNISEPQKLVKRVDDIKNILCFGEAKGSVNITVTGGVMPYRYKWSNGYVSQDLVDVVAGKYSVQISDANGCTDSLSASINQNPLLSAKANATNIKCYGQKSGTVDLSVEGGVAPYTYKWNNGSIVQDIIGLGAGQYSVSVIDSKGCTSNVSAQIVEPTPFVVAIESDKDINCYGDASGFIKINATGGVTPYKYKWNSADTTGNLTNVKAGTYILNASDANGCTQIARTTLVQPKKVDYAVKSITNVSCFGENKGAIDISVTGGMGPFTYKWSNGNTTQDIDNVAAGKYSVTINDANGCSNKIEAEISQPAQLALKLDSVVNILCHGDKKGNINLGVSGGVQPYKYSWSNGAITQDISLQSAGNYSVTVTDAKGCVEVLNATITEPPVLTAKLLQVNNISCFGEKSGSVSIEVLGGVQPYAYKWSNGTATKDLAGVGAGNYTVEVSDKNGCRQGVGASISQPSKLVGTLSGVKNVTCFDSKDGAIDVIVTGGTAPYKYKWNNGSLAQDLIDIPSGNYTLSITDGKGCTDSTVRASIKQPVVLAAKVERVSDVLKYGESTGVVNISVAGGAPPYNYSWSNGAITQNIAGVPGGDYSVKVRDNNGCEKLLTASIKQPPALAASIALVTNIKCGGDKSGAITLNVTGGVPPYSYRWSNGDSTMNISNVMAGNYSVIVTDANGHHQTVNAQITQPTPLTTKLDQVRNVMCYNDKTGAVSVSTNGGSAPYKFQWNNNVATEDLQAIGAGDYTLTVLDGNGCKSTLNAKIIQPEAFTSQIAEVVSVNCKGEDKGEIHIDVKGGVAPYNYFWSNGARTKDITRALAGAYSVRVTDANGCVNTVNATITEPLPFVATLASSANNLCNGDKSGSININVSGGTSPYKFRWSNGDSTQNITSLLKGEYSVAITDTKGCQQRLVASITDPPAMIASVKEVGNIKCYGEKTGKVNVEVTGGSTPYTYTWNNSATTQNIVNIVAGDYQLTVKDAKGCSKVLSAQVKQPAMLDIKLDTVSQVSCFGENKGLIDVTVSGGVVPYAYSWSNGSRTEDLINIMAGAYSLTVKDGNGCSNTITATIAQPEKLTVKPDLLTNIKCAGDEAGVVNLVASGGKAPYRYLWSNGATTQKIEKVAAGEYVATVTDANNCSANYKANVTEPNKLIKTIDAITNIRCQGDSTGSVQVTVREGTSPYTFSWSNGEKTEDIRKLLAGKFTLTITEGNGCKSTLEAVVEEPEKFVAQVANVSNINCFGDKTGAIDINVTGGTAPYRYAWSNGSRNEDLSKVLADNYSVIVSDANGCLKTLYADVRQPDELNLRIDSVKNVKCCGDNSGAIYVTIEGGVKPYQYKWSHGATTEDIQNLVLGVYTLNVTDANGCVVGTPSDMSLYEQVVSEGKFTTREILFDVAKATIKPESFNTINRIASFMKEHPDINFRIDGHTDSDGTAESNQKLSEDRAFAIRMALIKFGIRENRLQSKGWGESKPIATNVTSEGKSMNRRVEFVSLTGTMEGTLMENALNRVNK